MRIICPECHAAYQVGPMIKNAILVCHRCNTEFDTFGNKIAPDNETLEVFKKQEVHAPTVGLRDLIQSGMATRHTHFWAWLIIILFSLSVLGLSIRWDHWQYDSFFRAISLDTNLTTTILDRDWQVLPDTIHTRWLTRDDQSVVLIIEGQVKNLVDAALHVPEIEVAFVTQTGKDIKITQAITEPVDFKALQRVPFSSPPVDKTPIAPSGSRGFLLLVEHAPRSTQHIVLHAVAVQQKGTTKL